jgi:Transposase domain (DUF772)
MMARYKYVDMSPRLLPVVLEAQLVPGSFAHALHHLIDELDLSAFDGHYRNDEAGATAHDPAMLLRAVLLGYSQGLVSSRGIERACREKRSVHCNHRRRQAAFHHDCGLHQSFPGFHRGRVRSGAFHLGHGRADWAGDVRDRRGQAAVECL